MKFSIQVDMGAKNNGVFIAKTNGNEVLSKRAFNILVQEKSINFSKKPRRNKRHQSRNFKRRYMAKRLLREFINFENYTKSQQNLTLGILNNRGYTFLNADSEFEQLQIVSKDFLAQYISDSRFPNSLTKDEFEKYFAEDFDNDEELIKFLSKILKDIYTLHNELDTYSKTKDILIDFKSIDECKYKKTFKQFTYIKNIFDTYNIDGLRSYNAKNIIEKIKNNNIDLSCIDIKAEKQKLDDIEHKFFKFFQKIDDDFLYENEGATAKEIAKNQKEMLDTIRLDLGKYGLKGFLDEIQKELNTGSKPREKYLKEIKEEIEKDFDFLQEFSKDEFFNLVGNISNLQLKILRKYFNGKFDDKLNIKKLGKKTRKHFKAFHYKTNKEKVRKNNLFNAFKKHQNMQTFLTSTDPALTIPPYEDMNNRNTYKCNSMLIKPELINEDLKDILVDLLGAYNLFTKEEYKELKQDENKKIQLPKFKKISITSGNQRIEQDFTYSKYLQRILDATENLTTKDINPRNVFKYQKANYIKAFKKNFNPKIYETLRQLATRYYEEEEKILGGIYEEKTSIFVKCNSNTPHKNNIKHTLLKPIYSCKFSPQKADDFIEAIKSKKGLQTALKRISDEAKKHQNSFYHIIEACFENIKCIDDKDVKIIVKNINKNFLELKSILENDLDIKVSYLSKATSVTKDNLKRVLNTLKQTYEILFKGINGFNKTCKHCTLENNIRSDEDMVLAKRLLSDVAKPIDGMLDMMLDRISYEIVKNVTLEDIKDIDSLEILLEQNKFDFEESLNAIKKANNKAIKDFDKNKYKDKLNVKICPYSGKSFEKGDFDHILPQSKGVYNSKANLIYCSVEGNQKIKGNKDWTLENIMEKAPNHLKAIFGNKNLQEIKATIKQGIESIKIQDHTNFNNLKLHQQIALRYALFMRETDEFKKAFNFVRQDKIKTFSNGTQKRLARFIYEKLVNKFPSNFKYIQTTSKVIDSQLVSATRKYLAHKNKALKKQEKQDTHSHCIDAMVVFYLANSHIKGIAGKKKENIDSLEPNFAFKDIYVSASNSKNIIVQKSTLKDRFKVRKNINSIASTEVLFRENMVGVHYLNIYFKEGKFELGESIKNTLRFSGFNETILKYFEKKEILQNFAPNSYRVNIKTLNTILFNDKEEVLQNIQYYKKIDGLRYATQKKSILTLLDNFIKPTQNDEKKFLQKNGNFTKPFKTEHFNKKILALFFKKGDKTKHKGIVLKIDYAWTQLANFLENNRDKFIKEVSTDKSQYLSIDNSKLIELLQNHTFFKKTHTTKRKTTRMFSLPMKDTTDRAFTLRRKNFHKEDIFQYVLAKNSLRGFYEDDFIHKTKMGNFHTNIIPTKIEDYQKAFKK